MRIASACRSVVIVVALGLRAGSLGAQEVERDVPVPMHDGVGLRADVHRPDGEGPFPVLVLRTPYGKQGVRPTAYVKAGYIVVCQDARGRYASDGEFESFVRRNPRCRGRLRHGGVGGQTAGFDRKSGDVRRLVQRLPAMATGGDSGPRRWSRCRRSRSPRGTPTWKARARSAPGVGSPGGSRRSAPTCAGRRGGRGRTRTPRHAPSGTPARTATGSASSPGWNSPSGRSRTRGRPSGTGSAPRPGPLEAGRRVPGDRRPQPRRRRLVRPLQRRLAPVPDHGGAGRDRGGPSGPADRDRPLEP